MFFQTLFTFSNIIYVCFITLFCRLWGNVEMATMNLLQNYKTVFSLSGLYKKVRYVRQQSLVQKRINLIIIIFFLNCGLIASKSNN